MANPRKASGVPSGILVLTVISCTASTAGSDLEVSDPSWPGLQHNPPPLDRARSHAADADDGLLHKEFPSMCHMEPVV